jgi:urocanate hydratase
MVLDGKEDTDKKLEMMLFWDVNNGIARRSWARNQGSMFSIQRAMQAYPDLKVTFPNNVNDVLLDELFK